MGSRRAFRCATVQEGVTRRSEEELSDVICKGMSAAAAMLSAA